MLIFYLEHTVSKRSLDKRLSDDTKPIIRPVHLSATRSIRFFIFSFQHVSWWVKTKKLKGTKPWEKEEKKKIKDKK